MRITHQITTFLTAIAFVASAILYSREYVAEFITYLMLEPTLYTKLLLGAFFCFVCFVLYACIQHMMFTYLKDGKWWEK